MPYVKRRAPRKNYRRRVRRYGGKRRRYSKKSIRPTRARLTRFTNGIPDNAFVKLKYADIATFPNFNSSGNIGYSLLQYAGNRINDPGLTIDNHNANSVPQWANFYNNYTCYGSKITVKLIHTLTGAQLMGTLRAVTDDSLAGSSSDIVTQAMTDPNVRYTTIGSEEASTGIRTLSMYRTWNKMMGGKSGAAVRDLNNVRFLDDSLDTADPDWRWLLTVSDLDETAAGGSPNVRALVKITYYIKLFNKADIDMSTNA